MSFRGVLASLLFLATMRASGIEGQVIVKRKLTRQTETAAAVSYSLGNYPKDHTRLVTVPKPGIIFVNCHAAGRFSPPGVPAGSYIVVARRRTAGYFRQRIQVTTDRTAAVQFVIPLGEDRLTIAQR